MRRGILGEPIKERPKLEGFEVDPRQFFEIDRKIFSVSMDFGMGSDEGIVQVDYYAPESDIVD